VTAEDSETVAVYTLNNRTWTLGELLAFQPSVLDTNAAQVTIDVSSKLSDFTGNAVRAESTQNAQGTSNPCKLQAPTPDSYSASTYAAASGTADDSLTNATHCQGANLQYTMSVTGFTSLPSWAHNPDTSTCSVKPSSFIVSDSSLSTAYTVTVTVKDDNAVQNSASSNFAATFTNSAPTVASAITDQSGYQGQTISVPSLNTHITDSDDTCTFTATQNSGTTAEILSINNNVLSIFMPKSYHGTFQCTVTCTDSVGQTVSDEFNVTILQCPQANCAGCSGIGSNDCTK
jgi:LysM repeat protein